MERTFRYGMEPVMVFLLAVPDVIQSNPQAWPGHDSSAARGVSRTVVTRRLKG